MVLLGAGVLALMLGISYLGEAGASAASPLFAGPVIAGGMVFTNSGYGMWQGLPGNVLLAFGK